MAEFKLKRPYVVWVMALALIGAPPANFAIALYRNSISNWASPETWLKLFQALPLADQILFSLLPVAGLLLFWQRKTSWFFAMATLVAIVVQNVVSWLQGGIDWSHAGSFVAVNLTTLILFFHFRFPYLDQRDHLFRGIAQRYPVNLDATIIGFGLRKMVNISETGCFVQFSESDTLPTPGDEIQIQFLGFNISGKIAHRRNFGCGIQFTKPTRLNRSQIIMLVGDKPPARQAS